MTKKASAGVRITLGFVLGAALNALIFGAEDLLATRLPLTPVRDHIGFFSFALFGVVQSIWQVPLILFLAFKGHQNLVLGAAIAFVLTILLNFVSFYFLVKW
jgi:hypothetical protein